MYQFVFNYDDQKRAQLDQFKNIKTLEAHLNNQNLFDQFMDYIEGEGISNQTPGVQKSKELILTRIKANIARNIMNNEGYYPVIQQVDNTLLKSIELLSEGQVN